MKKYALLLASVSAQLAGMHFHRVRSAAGIVLCVPKLLVSALSPFVALMGLLAAVLGLLTRAPFAIGAGLFGFVVSGRYVWRVVSAAGDFDAAFGPDSLARITPAQKERMLRRRWSLRPAKPPEPRSEQNVPLWTISGSDRQLLCDIWQPPAAVPPSGLAFVYLHGSGWHFLDKDFATRPMFRQLAGQGHVIMDVAYRMCPEADWRGIQGDAKRAVAWMKANAGRYGVDPRKIVIAGGSAGGHLALLTAYTATDSALRPEDVGDADLSVCGVISWYGPSDMRVYDEFAGPKFSTMVGEAKTSDRVSEFMSKTMGIDTTPPASFKPGLSVQENMMRGLFGGTVSEVPEEYRLASPITHVGPHCPPTLLLQGEHDFVVNAEAVTLLAQKLRAAGAPVVHVQYPQTEHAFDLILPQISPPAQAALYETERFLAILGTMPLPAEVNIPAAPAESGALMGV